MTMTQAAHAVERRDYGNWRKPRTGGLGKLNLSAVWVMFAGAFATMITLWVFSILPALVVALVFAAALLVAVVKDRHDRSIGQNLGARAGSASAARRGENLYRSGPLSRVEHGRFRAPGIMARSRLSEHLDAKGRPFALLYVPATAHYTLVMRSFPDGTQGKDQPVIDQLVEDYGGFLASLGEEGDVVAAQVVIESAPDPGTKFQERINARLRPDAAPFAAEVLTEIRDTQATGSNALSAWITVTFSARSAVDGKRRSDDAMGRDLARRVPAYLDAASLTGAGDVRGARAAELCENVRVSYDPAAATMFDQARAAGQELEVSWDDVGPSAAQAEWGAYRHDSGTSVTWAMTGAPRGQVREHVLSHLLAPTAGVARKRVTLLYEPLSPAAAATTVESDKAHAEVRASSARPSSRSRLEYRAATQAADEEARGAGLTDFGLLVTATVTDDQELAWAKAQVEQAAAPARVQLRPVYGSQDSAFAATLPLGLVLGHHVSVPKALREVGA
ncbi:SCO6880 family protein [Isoptericola sp. F-RaC21]|uniref:SCO6880 family protein n=1 Tax=Isoptericola sp. F-RaC21 TaxID=3141452 RepID=UPI00315B6750